MHKEFFQTLQKDHEEVKGILKHLKETSARASKSREDLFSKLKKEIVPHMKSEEKVFYPALKEKKEAREDTLESIQEHHVAELVLNELDANPKNGEEWGAKLSVFKEIVEHHIEEEEEKIFQDARKELKEDEMERILKGFNEEKEKIKSSMA